MIYIFKKENGDQIKINSLDSIKSLIEEGTITQDTEVKKGLRGKWVNCLSVSEIKEIFDQFELEEEKDKESEIETVETSVPEDLDPQEDEQKYFEPEILEQELSKDFSGKNKDEARIRYLELKEQYQNEQKKGVEFSSEKIELLNRLYDALPNERKKEKSIALEQESKILEKDTDKSNNTTKDQILTDQKALEGVFNDENVIGFSFIESIKLLYRNYFNFSGRASRGEYWWVQLYFWIIYFVAILLSDSVPVLAVLFYIIILLTIIPSITVAVRRLHDCNKSGFYFFIQAIPLIGWLIYIIMQAEKGTPGTNRFGPYPLKIKRENISESQLNAYDKLPEVSGDEYEAREEININQFDEEEIQRKIKKYQAKQAEKKSSQKTKNLVIGLVFAGFLINGFFLSNNNSVPSKAQVTKVTGENNPSPNSNLDKGTFSFFDKYQKGKDLYDKGKFTEAIKVWEKCSEDNNPKCLYALGYLYSEGSVVSLNNQKALDYFIKASNLGHIKATYNAGYFFSNGFGTIRDFKKAEEYYLVAHNKKFQDATYNLSVILADDNNPYKDLKESFKYALQLANKNHINASYNVGLKYLGGEGTQKDYRLAEKYLKIAADAGMLESVYIVGYLLIQKENPYRNLDKALEYLEIAKKNKVKKSYLAMAIIYRDKNMPYKAFEVCQEGANLGDDDCHFNLGLYYFLGEGVAENRVQSTKHFIISNKIKKNSQTEENILANLKLMNNYQIELARKYANDWLQENKNILNGEQFYQKNKVETSLENVRKEKNSYENKIKKIDYRTVSYLNEKFILSSENNKIHSDSIETASCQVLSGKNTIYKKCEDSNNIQYLKVANLSNSEKLRAYNFAKVKEGLSSNNWFDLKATSFGNDKIQSGGWKRKSDQSIVYGASNTNNEWIVYTSNDGKYLTNTGLPENLRSKYIEDAKKNYKSAQSYYQIVDQMLEALN